MIVEKNPFDFLWIDFAFIEISSMRTKISSHKRTFFCLVILGKKGNIDGHNVKIELIRVRVK